MIRWLVILLMLLPMGQSAQAWKLGSAQSGSSPFIIIPVWDASALAAPQSFRDGVNAAITILQNTISSPITLSFTVSYLPSSGGGQAGSSNNPGPFTYTTVYNAYAAIPNKSADQTAAFASFPVGSSINGQSVFFFVAPSIAKAVGGLGISARDTSVVDGVVGIGDSVPSSSLVGAALHEITHAMGREANGGNEPYFQWLTYKAAGVRWGDQSTTPPHYISLDGGTTNIASLDGSGTDISDFSGSNTPDDVFNVNYNPASPYTQNLTAIDRRVLNVLGYKIP